MFCRNCGAQIDDRAEICPKCGVRVNPQRTTHRMPALRCWDFSFRLSVLFCTSCGKISIL